MEDIQVHFTAMSASLIVPFNGTNKVAHAEVESIDGTCSPAPMVPGLFGGYLLSGFTMTGASWGYLLIWFHHGWMKWMKGLLGPNA